MAKRLGRQVWARHVAAAAASGLSGAAYCRQQGINGKTFQRWVRLLRGGDGAGLATPAVLPLSIVPERVDAPAWVRIELGGAVVVTVPCRTDPRWLGAVLRAVVTC